MNGGMTRRGQSALRAIVRELGAIFERLSAALGRHVGASGLRALPPAPRPDAVDLRLEREAQGDPDGDDDAEYRDALDRWVDDDGSDDVGHDQDFEAEQNGPAQVPAKFVVCLLCRLGS